MFRRSIFIPSQHSPPELIWYGAYMVGFEKLLDLLELRQITARSTDMSPQEAPSSEESLAPLSSRVVAPSSAASSTTLLRGPGWCRHGARHVRVPGSWHPGARRLRVGGARHRGFLALLFHYFFTTFHYFSSRRTRFFHSQSVWSLLGGSF